jgi:Mg2+ and Co2+ transporter CorA
VAGEDDPVSVWLIGVVNFALCFAVTFVYRRKGWRVWPWEKQ